MNPKGAAKRQKGLRVFNVRSRLVNFRVTEDEFQRLKTAASLQGCRCMSEFARMVMLGSSGGQWKPEAKAPDNQMVLLDKRLTELESNVTRLAGKLQVSPLASD